jgi:hypothetical protein
MAVKLSALGDGCLSLPGKFQVLLALFICPFFHVCERSTCYKEKTHKATQDTKKTTYELELRNLILILAISKFLFVRKPLILPYILGPIQIAIQ